MTKSASIKLKKQSKYIRLPLDENISKLIALVQSENPFFTELDVIRYILGRYVTQNQNSHYRDKFLNWLDTNVGQKQLPKMSEEQIFQTLNSVKLDR